MCLGQCPESSIQVSAIIISSGSTVSRYYFNNEIKGKHRDSNADMNKYVIKW